MRFVISFKKIVIMNVKNIDNPKTIGMKTSKVLSSLADE